MVHRVEMSELPPVRHDDFLISFYQTSFIHVIKELVLSVNQLLKELHSQLNLNWFGL